MNTCLFWSKASELGSLGILVAILAGENFSCHFRDGHLQKKEPKRKRVYDFFSKIFSLTSSLSHLGPCDWDQISSSRFEKWLQSWKNTQNWIYIFILILMDDDRDDFWTEHNQMRWQLSLNFDWFLSESHGPKRNNDKVKLKIFEKKSYNLFLLRFYRCSGK